MEARKKSEFELRVIQIVKEKREKAGLSQADLAYKMEVSLSFIGMVESPKYPHKYNLDHLNALASIFNCSPRELLPDMAV
jgi:ribosome-binding protein aMBF1 (putative translation factor)